MFNIPNLLTASNLMCGVFAIIATLSGHIDLAPWLIFLAAIFDFLDGFAARLLKQQSPLGGQLDSLADMVTFGVAPGILMFVVLILCGGQAFALEAGKTVWSLEPDNFHKAVKFWIDGYFTNLFTPSETPVFSKFYLFLPFIAFLIPFFSLFRLAKFNLDTRQTDGFLGLNTPANTLFFCAFPLLLVAGYNDPVYAKTSQVLLIYQIPMTLVVLFSFMLVTEIPFFSLKVKSFGWKGNEMRFSFLFTSLILFLLFGWWAIGLVILLYIMIAVIQTLIYK
jgi:CDP-diacylglycerol--serine O-phosphatidyltransferase